MNRWLAVCLSLIAAALVAVLCVYFGAYAGLAPGTHWQQVFAAVIFVMVVAGWLVFAARQLAPGGGLRGRASLPITALAIAAASAIWLLLFWT